MGFLLRQSGLKDTKTVGAPVVSQSVGYTEAYLATLESQAHCVAHRRQPAGEAPQLLTVEALDHDPPAAALLDAGWARWRPFGYCAEGGQLALSLLRAKRNPVARRKAKRSSYSPLSIWLGPTWNYRKLTPRSRTANIHAGLSL